MSILKCTRIVNPACVDLGVFSCFTRKNTGLFSTCVTRYNVEGGKSSSPSKVFVNRNPRCLEQAGIAPKRQGWTLQYPSKNFYYKLHFEVTNRNISANIEHNTEEVIISASTKEWAIKQGLYSTTDISAARNIGKILAERCLQAGINSVFYDEDPSDKNSEKMQAFLGGLRDGQLLLEEQEYIPPEFKPGIDYSKPNRYAEKKEWKDDYQID